MASPTSHMPRVSARTLLFPFFIRLKLGFSALNRTSRISLSSNDSKLSTGMSGSCQLLSIKAQALAKNRPSPPLPLLLYALICPELTCIALSPISCFIHRSSLHLVSMYSLSAVILSPVYIRSNWCTFIIPAARNPSRQTKSAFLRMGSGHQYVLQVSHRTLMYTQD